MERHQLLRIQPRHGDRRPTEGADFVRLGPLPLEEVSDPLEGLNRPDQRTILVASVESSPTLGG